MIIEVCKDMASFAFVLAIAMIAFGNVFYILDYNAYSYAMKDYDATDPTATAPAHLINQGNFLIALIYSFNMGLGNFMLDGYQGAKDEPLLWIIFLLEVILIQIILLNLLISIMGDTFGRVTSVKEQSKLREICTMISEYNFLLNRKAVYKNSKYIIVVKLEKAG
jgi:hypothetical protein